MTSSRKVLVVSPIPTHPPHRGNRQRVIQMGTLLRHSGFDVELVVGKGTKMTDEAEDFWPVIHRLPRSLKWRPSRRNVPYDAWYSEGTSEAFVEIVESSGANAVFLNYIFHSKVLESLPDHVVKVIDTHDVFTERRKLYRRAGPVMGFFSCPAEDEAQYLRRAHAAIAISPSDLDHFRTICPELTAFEIPYFTPIEREPARNSLPHISSEAPHSPVFGVVMSSNDVNTMSLKSFVAAVDQIYGQKPPFRVRVAGEIGRNFFARAQIGTFQHRRPWLEFLGPQDNLGDFYQSLDAVLVPVTGGSGMAIKFAEALALKMPVFSTTAGSRGVSSPSSLHRFEDNVSLVRALGGLTKSDYLESAHTSQTLQQQLSARVSDGQTTLSRFLSGTNLSSPSHPHKRKDSFIDQA